MYSPIFWNYLTGDEILKSSSKLEYLHVIKNESGLSKHNLYFSI